jgi:serine/threonine protein kinase
VIHRDLKPANVFLIHHDDDSDFVKVLDFGLVKNLDEADGESLTKTGLFMGSPKYMAPEQIRGDRCTPATDVYALGVMLFEMLTGKVPFELDAKVADGKVVAKLVYAGGGGGAPKEAPPTPSGYKGAY